jgi:hypothetical protein
VEQVMARENRSFELPNYSYPLNEKINRVVVNTAEYDLTIETTDEKEVSAFGTYRLQTTKKAKLINTADDYVTANQKGDTLYLYLKTLPNEAEPFGNQGIATATLLIPNDVTLEVSGSDNSITLKPRTLTNDWNIERASSIVVDVAKNSNLKISAVGIDHVSGKDGEWQVTEKTNAIGTDNTMMKNAIYQAGEGNYHINIANAYNISLNTN